MKRNFEVGDKVYHISLPSVAWVIEKIEDDVVHCSTLVKATLELKREKFEITSIKKASNGSITVIRPKRSNNFW